MNESTKWKLVVILAACWALLLVLGIIDGREPQRVPLTYVSGQTAKAERGSPEPALVSLAPSDRASVPVPRRPARNLFAPLAFPRPKPGRPAAKPEPPPPPPKLAAPAPPPPPSPEEVAAAQARKQLAQYRVLGYSAKSGEPRAFLGRENRIYIAEVGETIEDHIEVAAITEKAVRLREVRTRVEATLQYEKKE